MSAITNAADVIEAMAEAEMWLSTMNGYPREQLLQIAEDLRASSPDQKESESTALREDAIDASCGNIAIAMRTRMWKCADLIDSQAAKIEMLEREIEKAHRKLEDV